MTQSSQEFAQRELQRASDLFDRSFVSQGYLDKQRTEVHFETDITLDFELSFPLNLMPEGILKYMTEAIMSKIMQQATESMLCQVQNDL